MKHTVQTTLLGITAITVGLLAAGSAQADRVSVGLGLSDGYGNFLSVGVNNGWHRGCGPGYYGGVCLAPRPVVVQPAPVVYAQPAPVVYAQPAPVVYAQPPAPVVYAQPAPVVYAQPAPVVVQPSGYWVETDNTVWIAGGWVEVTDAWGRRVRQQGPGHWEHHRGREWRQGPGGGDRGGVFGGGGHGGPGGSGPHR